MVFNVLGAAVVLAAWWTAIAICANTAGMRYRAFAVRAPVERGGPHNPGRVPMPGRPESF